MQQPPRQMWGATMTLDYVHLRQLAAVDDEFVYTGLEGEPGSPVSSGGGEVAVRGGLLVRVGVDERRVRGMLQERGRRRANVCLIFSCADTSVDSGEEEEEEYGETHWRWAGEAHRG